jgi:hypothetical protein
VADETAPGIERGRFVLAVREEHHGPASEAAFDARLALAEEYLDADLPDEAIEVLLGAVIDANRLYGATDIRTIAARLQLGAAYGSADRPFDACGVYENLRVEVRAARAADDPMVHQVLSTADAAYAALEAEHGPLG